MNGVGRTAVGRALLAILGLVVVALLAGCAPVNDPSAGMSVPEAVTLIDQVEASDITLETIAEAFALNTRATDVQRENLQAELVGRRVDWDIPIYEVSFSEGRYEVTSQPIPIQDPEAAPLIRVMAVVIPTSDADAALLQAMKTDDVIRVRGVVQEIRLRTIVAIAPAIVVSANRAADTDATAQTPSADPASLGESDPMSGGT